MSSRGPDGLRRIVVAMIAFLMASAVGALFLLLALLLDPQARELAAAATLAGVSAMVDTALDGGAPEGAALAFLHFLRAVLLATAVAPLAIAALIGEIASARALGWYAGASGLLAAASPWIARAASGSARAAQMSEMEGRIALLLFLTGVVAGSVYWLISRMLAPRGDPRSDVAVGRRAKA